MNWRFTIIDYTFNPSGISTVLSDEPIGFKDFEINVKRDLKTHGIFFEESVGNLGFWGSGLIALSAAYAAKGSEAYTEILIEIQCDDSYEEAYRGKFDYSRVKFFDEDDCYATAPIEQIGCIQTFRNRIEQKVDLLSETTINGTALPVYDGLPESITLFSKPLQFKSKFVNATSEFTINNLSPSVNYLIIKSFDWELGVSEISDTSNISEEMITEVSTGDTFADFSQDSFGLVHYQQQNLQCGGILTIHVRLKGTFEEFSADSRNYSAIFQFRQIAADNVTIKDSVQLTPNMGGSFAGSATNSVAFDVTYDNTLNIAPGDKLFVTLIFSPYFFTTGGVGANNEFDVAIDFEESEVSATIQDLCNDSESQVFLVNEALSRITEIISDDCLKVYSEYFGRIDSEPYALPEDGCGALACVTNGLFIRNAKLVDESDPKIFLSFKDLYDGLNAIHCLGMGIEEYLGDTVLRVERFDHFYQDSELLSLDGIRRVQVEVDPARIINTVKIGYSKWESEYTGGLDEIQSKREYKTDITSTETVLNAESNLVASTYAIEVTRRTGNTTEDFKYDNDLFIICLDRVYTGYQPELWNFRYENIISVNYLMNLRISPIRNLLRWFKLISPTWNKEYSTVNKQLIFASGDGNYIAETEKTDDEDCIFETQPWSMGGDPGDLLGESETIDKLRFKDTGTNADPIYQPHTFTGDYPFSYEQFQLVKASPYEYLTFTKGAAVYSGWILEMKWKPAEGLAKFKTLVKWP